jgi:nicotinic acid mononucleotide adenylyltransferase
VVFSGAFNPRHAGHARMAEIAERKLNAAVAWELSITNVDKPPLDYIAIDERVEGIRREDSGCLIALTRAPTFREKAALFPGATFVVGADTLERIAEPRYYGGDAARRDAAIAEIARTGCRFLVFGRASAGQFISLANLQLPGELRQLCNEVPASEFREDVSSTTLRQSSADS